MRTNPKSAALNGKKWTFVRSDMDDLRSGVPVPMTEKDMVIKVRTYVRTYVHPLNSQQIDTTYDVCVLINRFCVGSTFHCLR